MAIESFEGLTAGNNIPNKEGSLQPGYNSVYTFKSGVSLIDPIPNSPPNVLLPAVVNDFRISAANTWSLGSNGTVEAEDVPDGTAYMAIAGQEAELQFGFNRPIYKVGAFVNAERSEHHLGIHMSAFDAQGNLITCSHISSVAVGDWKTNYISVISHVPIAKVLIYGDYLVVDELGFTADEQTVVRGTRRSETIDRDHKMSNAGSTNKAEIILGRRGDDKIDASGGHDHVRGGWGDDVLRGGKGNDTLIGGRGHDRLFGDGGQDSFLFRHFGSDKLKDFTPSDDTIVLDHARFSAIEPGHLDESQFEVGAAATDADDRILYDSASGKLFYDEDGTGPSGAVQFAKLAAGLSLTAEEFAIT